MASEHFDAHGWGRADAELYDSRLIGDELPELYENVHDLPEERGITRLRIAEAIESVVAS